MNEKAKDKKHSMRVDFQVAFFTAAVVVASCLCIFALSYFVTYQDMLNSLEERVNSIYMFLESDIDKTTFFDINTPDDMDKASYSEMRLLFERIRSVTGVQYLYTAKKPTTES